jgi:hypothetical protein
VRFAAVALGLLGACSFSARNAQQTPGDGNRDVVIGPDGGPCTAAGTTCNSVAVLRTCSAPGAQYTDTACDWGCIATPMAHCGAFAPTSNGAEATDLTMQPGLLDVTISGSVNSDNGAMAGATVRAMGTGIQSGVGFRIHGNVAVFTAKSFQIGATSITGSHAIAFVATGGDITIDGLIDLTSSCVAGFSAAPGGFNGAIVKGADGTNDTASSTGGGKGAATSSTGGGGGAHGGTGGAGKAAAGGAPYGDPEISVLSGGAGGGAGSGGGSFGIGGGGGGAIQIVTAAALTITSSGSINAGGCGGLRGAGGGDSGGGGGAGGTVLLEARTMSIAGTLAVNGGGGGGGGGGNASNGETGLVSTTAADGGDGDGNGENGGSGASGGTFDGHAAGTGTNPGGGGGAIGRMRFNTYRNLNLTTTGATLSPNLVDSGTTTSSGSAAVR